MIFEVYTSLDNVGHLPTCNTCTIWYISTTKHRENIHHQHTLANLRSCNHIIIYYIKITSKWQKKYWRFATVHMIYWFVDLCSSSIHRSVGRYFISTRYPSNDKYGGPSFSITNHNIYLYYWLLWIADIFKWQHEMIYWGQYIYITIKWVGYPCKAIGH